MVSSDFAQKKKLFKQGEENLKNKMNLFIKIFKLRKRRKPTSAVSQKHYLLYKEEAREVILRRVVFFTAKYNFQYKRLAIKNTKTRWGSCSTKRNLNFNYKILFLENNLRDYIIVHELCHLQEMNHSKNF